MQYLVLWKGWPKEASQWLTAKNIGSALLRYKSYKMHKLTYTFFMYREFNNPHPQEYVVREAVGNFTLAIDRSLRVACTKNTILRIPFRHDVVRYLFQDKHELTLSDFDNNFFPYGWNQWYQQHGSPTNATYCGRTIVFPIRIKCYLQWTRPNGFVKNSDNTIQPKRQTFIEMIRVYIVKENC